MTSPSQSALVIFEAPNRTGEGGDNRVGGLEGHPDVRDRYTRETAQKLVSGRAG